MRTGASSGARSYRPNGRRWTAPPPRPRPGSTCAAASRPAFPSIRPRSRCSSASGRRWPSTSRRGARSPCWRSGSPGLGGRASRRPARSPSSRWAPRRSKCRSSAARCSASSASPGSSRPSTPTSAERRPTPAPWTRIRRGACATSTGGWGRRSCSNPPAARSTRWPICPSCASPSASRRWTPPRWTAPRSHWRTSPGSSAARAPTGSGSATSRPCGRW